jgi:hypothetical protein
MSIQAGVPADHDEERPGNCAPVGDLFTGVTRWFIKSGVSPGERQNRLRQHGTLFFLFTKMLHVVQHFCEQERDLPPCRRRIGAFIPDEHLIWNRPRNSCYLHALHGRSSNRAFHPVNGRIACGSMVLLIFFTKIWLCEPNFREKDLVSSALPEAKFPARSVTA